MTSISPLRRGYVDTRWGQLHYRELGTGQAPPLICLHATAYSSRSLVPLLPHLAEGRRVIALDTPGYGESDGPPQLQRLEAYAEVMAEAIAALEPGRPVDLFGYHTGALLATEMAAQRPALVRRLVLIGVPFFAGAMKETWRRKLVHEHELGEDLAQFAARWDYFVTDRAAGVSRERGFESFVDELRAYPRDAWSHMALFDYDAGPRLPLVRQPVLVINPSAPLAEASRAAARLMPGARLEEIPELSAAIFDLGAARIATAMRPFLAVTDPAAAHHAA